jgi:acyl-CoA synthetase (AMP-forming)/AMP-acid ligase II
VLSFIAERAVEDAPALVRPDGQTMTFGTLAMASAAVMQAVGERVGDVARRIVGVAVPDQAGFVASVLAVLEAGGVVMPLDLRRGIPALEREAALARALAVIVGDPEDDRLDVVAVDASRRELLPEACLLLDAGVRKAVHSRAGLGIAVDAVAAHVGLDASSRLALVGPLAHGSVLTTALATLRAGGSIACIGRVAAEEQGAAAAAVGANVTSGAMAELVPLIGAPLARVVLVGDGDVAALGEAFPGARIGRALDTGEALRVAAAEGGAAWQPLPGVDWWRDGDAIEVHTPTAMLGYLDDPEATRAAVGERDGKRVVRAWPLDRVDAAALERRIADTPGVREAAVIAVRDASGERHQVFVAGDATAVPRHPARVVVLESLPHAADGTVDRQALRRMTSAD